MKNKTATKTATAKTVTTVKVHLCKTNYHYYRNWIKNILRDGKITSASFVRNEVGYDGVIKVASNEVVKAKNVLDKYQRDNTDVVSMWK